MNQFLNKTPTAKMFQISAGHLRGHSFPYSISINIQIFLTVLDIFSWYYYGELDCIYKGNLHISSGTAKRGLESMI